MLSVLLPLVLPMTVPLASPQAKLQTDAPRTSVRNRVIPPSEWEAVVREGKENSEAQKHLDHLTNRIGPRLTSSDNLYNACVWARDYWRSIGYANARIVKWGEYPVGFNRGPSSGSVLAPKSIAMPLVFVTRAWSAGTKGKQSGRAVWAPRTLAEAKERSDELSGCWLVQRSTGSGRPLARTSRELARYCESQGALGFVRSGNEIRRGTGLKNLLLTSGNYRIKWESLPTFPSIQIRWDQFQKIAKAMGAGEKVQLQFDVRNYFKKGPIPLYNVIADLEGTTTPEEYVVVGGHIDSWDGATGTTDNGTGTATTIEAARILKVAGVKPRRTIRFMLWSGEEQGLQGSRAWCQKNRKDVVKNCQACLVHDGGTNYAAGILGGEKQFPLLLKAFAGFDKIDARMPFDIKKGDQPSWGSDHSSFVTVGAPGFYWQQAGKATYRYTHHTQHDTFDAAVPGYQAQTSTVAALGALALANLKERMPPTPRRGRSDLAFGMKLDDKMVVTSVAKGSGMAKAGVRKGDKLVRLGAEKLAGRGAWRPAVMQLFRNGGRGKLELMRAGAKKKVDIDLSSMMRRGRRQATPKKKAKKRRRL